MGLREDIQKKIEKKQQELIERETAHRLARAYAEAYIQAMQDMLKTLPKDALDIRPSQPELRAGSAMAEARDALRKSGKPLHITELLRAMGRQVTKEARISIGGSLANYARRNEIFTKTAPNTFTLVGMDVKPAPTEPPSGFGTVRRRVASLTDLVEEGPDEGPDDGPGDENALDPDYDEPF